MDPKTLSSYSLIFLSLDASSLFHGPPLSSKLAKKALIISIKNKGLIN